MALTPSRLTLQDNVEFASYPTMTFYLDKSSRQLKSYVDGLPAVSQAVEIALSVERYKWQIYTSNYGVEFDGLIGQDYGFIASELKRRIIDALSVDDRILKVDDFVFTLGHDNNSLLCDFTVYSVFGDFASSMEVSI